MKLDVTTVGRNRTRERLRIAFAVGEMRGETRQANVNRSTLIPEAGDIDVHHGGRSDRGDQRKGKQDDGGPSHRVLAYQQRPAPAKCLNS